MSFRALAYPKLNVYLKENLDDCVSFNFILVQMQLLLL